MFTHRCCSFNAFYSLTHHCMYWLSHLVEQPVEFRSFQAGIRRTFLSTATLLPSHLHSHMHTHTQTDTHTSTHTHTERERETYRHTYAHTCTHRYTHTCTHTDLPKLPLSQFSSVFQNFFPWKLELSQFKLKLTEVLRE